MVVRACPPRQREESFGPAADVLPPELEAQLGCYQWRFLWLGVTPSTSTIFAPAGESRLLGHMGFVAWAQPDGDDDAPAELPLGTAVHGEGTSLHIWGASHICRGFEDVRRRRFVFTHSEEPGFHYVLDAMAVTARVWPGNAYPELGDSVRIMVVVLQPDAFAPAGFGDTQEALNYADRDTLRWVVRSLRPFIEEERAQRPRIMFQCLRAATASVMRMLPAAVDQHACVALEGPRPEGVDLVMAGAGGGIGLLDPRVKLGGGQSDHHASQVGEGGAEAWPCLPWPVRVSYAVHEGLRMPALYLGQAQRTQGGVPKSLAKSAPKSRAQC